MRVSTILPLAFAALVSAGDIIPALKACGCSEYADWLQSDDNLELLTELRGRNDGTVWCPPDEIVRRARAADTPSNPPESPRHRLVKRAGSSAVSRSVSHHRPRPAKRQEGGSEIPPSNYETIITYMEDPQYVNLGPGQPGRYVKNLGPSGSQQISSGGGDLVNQTSGPFRYDQGVIYTIDDFPSFPALVSDSIGLIGQGDDFWNAVVEANLDKYLDDTPACTVFVPIKFERGDDPRRQIVCGVLGYSPDLLPGLKYQTLAGTEVEVTFGDDGARRVDGQSLEKADVITKNGVIHVVAKAFGGGKHHY